MTKHSILKQIGKDLVIDLYFSDGPEPLELKESEKLLPDDMEAI